MVVLTSDCVGIHNFADVFGPIPVRPSIDPYFRGSKDSNYPKKGNGSLEVLSLDLDKKSCVGVEDFEVLKVVGRGSFGKVFQVRRKGSSNEVYAMKVISKDKVIEKNHVEYIKSEREILMIVDHPFIVKLNYTFQV